jgi:hypothetical protein
MTTPSQNDAARLRRVLDDVAAGRVTPVEASDLLAAQAPTATDGPAATGPAEQARTTSRPTDVWADVSDVTGTDGATGTQTVKDPGVTDVGARAGTGGGDAKAATAGSTRRGDEAEVVRARRVVIRAVGRRVRIIGEPSVATVSVDGAHVVRRDGATLTVTSEGELGASLDGFTLMRSRSFEDVRDSLLGFGRELAVRVNPDLEVDVEVTAGSVSVERVPKLSHVRVTAGSAKVLGAEGPLDLLVQAGSAKVDIRPTTGSSRLRVESGSLDVRIASGAHVRVRSDSQLGKVSWQGSSHQGTADEVTIGTGAATLALEVVMGSVQVRTD